MIAAVVPAAGSSRRMGRPKLSLTLGDRTVLEHVVAALRSADVDHVLVIVAPHVPELVPLAKASGADVCELPASTSDMRETVQHGLAWIEERFHPQTDDAWLLVPADHPALDPAVIREVCGAYRRDPSKSIVVPTHAGRRGHPALIAWKHVAAIRALPADLGINAYLRHHPERLELPVASSGAVLDLDTPSDLEALRRQFGEPRA